MAKTFLQFCGEVARESGAVGSAPTTVISQTGRQAKVVEWVRQANYQIQADNPDWSFLRQEFSGSLSPNIMDYSPATFSINGLMRWLAETQDYQPMSWFDPATPECEAPLRWVPYQSWRSSYFRGVHDASAPAYWSIRPSDNAFLIGPKPDMAYTVRGEYQAAPQQFSSDGDTSLIPEKYEDAITWRACMMLALHDEAPAAYQSAAMKYGAILTNMLRDLLPAIELGGNALA